MSHFSDRLFEAVRTTDSRLVVGLDPRFERIPEGLRPELDPDASTLDKLQVISDTYVSFCRRVVELVANRVPAVKVQVAFFEACGVPGMEAYRDVVGYAAQAGLLVIGDVKRGDIGSTAAAYAAGHCSKGPGSGETDSAPRTSPFAVDAVTVNPYFGFDGIEPFLEASNGTGGIFVLVRTSNPSAPTFQDLLVDGEPLYRRVAAEVDRWGRESDRVGESGYSSVGAVAGGTYPAELGEIRAMLPRTPLLVPGFGSQGAGPKDVAPAFDERGLGALINASRSILFAHEKRTGPWEDALLAAVAETNEGLNRVAKAGASSCKPQ